MPSEQHLRLGSVVLDRARNKPLRVVDRDHRRAGEHPDVKHKDAMARQWGVTEDDDVYKCVFLPTGEDAVTSPKRPYAYPESRLTRFPVEAALGDGTRRLHTQILVEFLAALLEVEWNNVDDDVQPAIPLPNAVAEAVIGADVDAEVPTEVLLEEAQELADVARFGGGEADV